MVTLKGETENVLGVSNPISSARSYSVFQYSAPLKPSPISETNILILIKSVFVIRNYGYMREERERKKEREEGIEKRVVTCYLKTDGSVS